MPHHSFGKQALIVLLLCVPALAQETTHFPGIDAMNAQFPEAPSEVKRHFFNKGWLAATAIQTAATGFDIAETLAHQGPCALEGNNGFAEHASGKELAFNGVVEIGFGVFVHALAYRAPKSFQWLNYMTPAYGTILHLKGGIEWQRRCG